MPSQKYTRGLVVDRTRKIYPDISPTPPLNFTGKMFTIRPRFSTPFAFDGSWLQNGGTYQRSNNSTLCDFVLRFCLHISLTPPLGFTQGSNMSKFGLFGLCGTPAVKQHTSIPDT